MAKISPVRFRRTANTVALVSTSTNLVPGITNGGPKVFVKDLSTGKVEDVAPVWDDSLSHMGGGSSVAISGDGRHIVFESYATDIISGVEGGALFWKDLDTHQVKLVAAGIAGGY